MQRTRRRFERRLGALVRRQRTGPSTSVAIAFDGDLVALDAHHAREQHAAALRTATFDERLMVASRPGQRRSTWAELLRRVFALDVLSCPHCGGPRRLIAQLTDATVLRKLFTRHGLPTEPPRPAPARSREQLGPRLSRCLSRRRARSSATTRGSTTPMFVGSAALSPRAIREVADRSIGRVLDLNSAMWDRLR
jgi:hypothetical protein